MTALERLLHGELSSWLGLGTCRGTALGALTAPGLQACATFPFHGLLESSSPPYSTAWGPQYSSISLPSSQLLWEIQFKFSPLGLRNKIDVMVDGGGEGATGNGTGSVEFSDRDLASHSPGKKCHSLHRQSCICQPPRMSSFLWAKQSLASCQEHVLQRMTDWKHIHQASNVTVYRTVKDLKDFYLFWILIYF